MAADEPCVAAGVFTLNVMCAAPVTYCKQVLAKGQPVKAVSRVPEWPQEGLMHVATLPGTMHFWGQKVFQVPKRAGSPVPGRLSLESGLLVAHVSTERVKTAVEAPRAMSLQMAIGTCWCLILGSQKYPAGPRWACLAVHSRHPGSQAHLQCHNKADCLTCHRSV